MNGDWERLLAQVTALQGVRGALVVSGDDGLVVHEAAMDGIDTSDVAALASAVVRRVTGLATSAGDPGVRLCTLAAEHGTLVAAQASDDLWLVAVAEPDAELGRLRLLLGDLAPEFA
ncbi:MAG TPA: roadblock/LC7 domain-containing protein [Gemmatimonadales bacterium]|nr:roadblock/LC7 domain-containing protein [Gemmatimonadales bacterium]